MNRLPVALAAAGALAVLAVAGALGAWILLHPENALTALFRAPISSFEARVVTGPYPMRADLAALKASGVGTIVSLLDPAIPYERALIGVESAAAGELGLTLLDFPMGSVLGRRFGDGYDRNAAAAAAAIKAAPGKVYVHCYLGMHRVKVVRALLESGGEAPADSLRRGERGADAAALDRAQEDFEHGRFEAALGELGAIAEPGEAAVLLRGWALYRLGRTAPAREAFSSALRVDAASSDALTGLGYCALREADANGAAARFESVLAARPGDPSATLGLALARGRQGRSEESRRLLEKVLASDPSNADARAALKALRPSR